MDINFLINNGINVNGSLEILGDIETYNEILTDFLSTIDDKMEQVKSFKEAMDMSNYAVLVHSLKSDARYLGFTKLAELSYNHEVESKANNVGYIYQNYDLLVEEVNRIVKIVKEYFTADSSSLSSNMDASDKKAILVVDDSNIVRNIVFKMLGTEYSAIFAEDGMEAIEKVNGNNNLIGVLLDLNMPNVNGFEVLKYFNDNNLFTKIPVAVITGDDSKETIYKAFDYPIVDVLAKPFNESDVKRVVTAMINYK